MAQKTIVLGDTHGREYWRMIILKEKPDRVIFIGDYFDTHDDISGAQQLSNYKEIIKFKEEHPEIEIIMLIGNHDHHYFPEVGYTGTSGYQAGAAANYAQILNDTKEHLQMAYMQDNILFTHAGVSETWWEQQFGEHPFLYEEMADKINELWKYKPKYPFEFNPSSRSDYSGDSASQTPIWIRPGSLMADNQTFKKHIIQVVGHTQMRKIDIEGKATGGRYYFIDTLGTSGEYLVIEDGLFTAKQL